MPDVSDAGAAADIFFGVDDGPALPADAIGFGDDLGAEPAGALCRPPSDVGLGAARLAGPGPPPPDGADDDEDGDDRRGLGAGPLPPPGAGAGPAAGTTWATGSTGVDNTGLSDDTTTPPATTSDNAPDRHWRHWRRRARK